MADKQVTCCGILEQISEQYDYPFYRPLTIDRETRDIKRGGWAVRCFRATPAGNISRSKTATAFLNYCPFCGAQLREADG